jgi:8-oxo-(d)GTP phosphatase
MRSRRHSAHNRPVPLLLIRHSWAGDRTVWREDDRLRPLDERGREQALSLVDLLADFPVEAIHTSPYVRCVQTVEPLAAERGLQILEREELGEERQSVDGSGVVAALRGADVVVCGHGGLQYALVDPPRKWRKGETLVVAADLRVVRSFRT